jgi:hypothetical protein
MYHFTDFHTHEESLTTWSLSCASLLALGIGILIILGSYWIPLLNQVFKWYFLAVGVLILLVLLGLSICQYVRVRIAMRMFVLLIHLLAIWLGYDWFTKATNTSASGIEVTVTSIGAQDRKIQVALPSVPAIEPEKLVRSQKATVVVPVEATVTSVDSKNRSLQLVLPPATALGLIARSPKVRLIIEP